MALGNSISVEFTAEELEKLTQNLTAIEEILRTKCMSLTPEERQEFARLGNRTENWSKKTMDYIRNKPSFNPSFLDVEETERDFNARQMLRPIFTQISALSDLTEDTMMLLGSDIYNSCVAYYRNVKLLAEQNVNGAKSIYEDLSAQFPGRPSQASKSAANTAGK
ncbi:MAG: hypothetical protein HC905_12480 [Bacteroidales bacterium]|nr:hypothetical protein [Bacteroidales bacterium]